MTPEEKELVALMEASGETPDAMLYRLRFAPPEKGAREETKRTAADEAAAR